MCVYVGVYVCVCVCVCVYVCVCVRNGFQSSFLHFYFREELQKPIRSAKIHFQDCGRGAASPSFRNRAKITDRSRG